MGKNIAVAVVILVILMTLTVKTVQASTRRGKKLTLVLPDSTGKILATPEAMRKQAEELLGRAIDSEAFALALMLSSEGLSDSWIKRRARAWVAFNDLKGLRKAFGWKSYEKLFTYSNMAGQNGHFGKQEKGRRYDTSRPLYESVLNDAEGLLAAFKNGNDPTGGATKFIDVKALGRQPGTEGKTLASVEKEWGLKGRQVEDDFYVFGGNA